MANGNGTMQSRVTRSSRVRRRVPFLDQLSPAARRAYEQELLDQAATFRQIAAARNGVPGVIDRNLLGDDTVETESEESLAQQPMPAPVEPTPAPTPPPAVQPSQPAQSPTINVQMPSLDSLTKPDWLSRVGKAALVASALAGTGLGGWGLSKLGQGNPTPTRPPEAPAVTRPVGPGPGAVLPPPPGAGTTGGTSTGTSAGQPVNINNDEAVLRWLNIQSGGPAPTDLGYAMQRAMQVDPTLRDKILKMVHETLDKQSAPGAPQR